AIAYGPGKEIMCSRDGRELFIWDLRHENYLFKQRIPWRPPRPAPAPIPPSGEKLIAPPKPASARNDAQRIFDKERFFVAFGPFSNEVKRREQLALLDAPGPTGPQEFAIESVALMVGERKGFVLIVSPGQNLLYWPMGFEGNQGGSSARTTK